MKKEGSSKVQNFRFILMTTKCKTCNNSSFKETTIQHLIKTRDGNRKEMCVENLPVKECNICGTQIFPERSEEVINIIKHIVQQEMERAAEKEHEEFKENQHSASSLMSFLKHLIS